MMSEVSAVDDTSPSLAHLHPPPTHLLSAVNALWSVILPSPIYHSETKPCGDLRLDSRANGVIMTSTRCWRSVERRRDDKLLVRATMC